MSVRAVGLFYRCSIPFAGWDVLLSGRLGTVRYPAYACHRKVCGTTHLLFSVIVYKRSSTERQEKLCYLGHQRTMPQSYAPFVTLDSHNNHISARPVSIADGFRLSVLS